MHISLVTVNLFNSVFMSGQYPMLWSGGKIFNIFKNGDRKDPEKYRGISVANAIVKLFDMVLCNRISLWFQPSREQAGAQKKHEGFWIIMLPYGYLLIQRKERIRNYL